MSFLNRLLAGIKSLLAGLATGIKTLLTGVAAGVKWLWVPLTVLLVLGAGIYGLLTHWPVVGIEPGEVGIRINRLTGGFTEVHEGTVLRVPGVHRLRRYSLRDQVYRPTRSSKATGEAPFQSYRRTFVGSRPHHSLCLRPRPDHLPGSEPS